MRKTDAERRAFLKNFRLRMVEIQDAAETRLNGERVPEAEVDALLEAVDDEWRKEQGIPKKRRRVHA